MKSKNVHNQESFSRRWWSLKWSRNSPPFLTPERSFPCSQGPTTGTYPEPAESNPRPISLLFF